MAKSLKAALARLEKARQELLSASSDLHNTISQQERGKLIEIPPEDLESLLANGWERLPGDAGKSESKWFVALRHADTEQSYFKHAFKVLCPTLLRGPLTYYPGKNASY